MPRSLDVSFRRMRVEKYIPDRLFGFLIDLTGQQVFFHLAVFLAGEPPPHKCPPCPVQNCVWADAPAPPILGELVDVEVEIPTENQEGKAPKATRVIRVNPATPLNGTVSIFDAPRGFGFLRGEDGVEYHLHNSEIIDRKLPVIGQHCMFYPGVRQGRPRACHVKVC